MSDTYETLRKWIIQGELEPGQRLFETQLAEQLGTSRTPIRESLRRLEIEGLIQFTPNRGAVVKKYGMAEIAHIFDLRVLIEGYSAGQAALHRTEAHCLELQSLNDAFQALYESVKEQQVLEDHVVEFVALNQTFHHVIWEAAANPQLPMLLERLIVIPLIYKSYHQYDYAQMGNSLAAHQVIGNAIIKQDPVRAEIAMKEHIMTGRDHAFTFLA